MCRFIFHESRGVSPRFTQLVVCVAVALGAIGVSSTAEASDLGILRTIQIVHGLHESAPTEVIDVQGGADWMEVELAYSDDDYPLVVNVLTTPFDRPEGLIFMLPVSGLNFRANFFSPEEDNLAHFFREQGYVVVGITPREDSVPELESYEFMVDWGIEQHREDVREIISLVTEATDMDYELLGYSYNSLVALDYAATYGSDDLERVTVIDIYNIDPSLTEEVVKAQTMYDAYLYLMDLGYFVDDSLRNSMGLIMTASLYPTLDSGVPRALLLPPELAPLYPGNHTVESLLYFTLIHSDTMPGLHSPITGLPNDWPLISSTAAGLYELAPDPADDEYSLDFVEQDSLTAVASQAGSGLIPLALQRDCMALSANNGAYAINFAGIDAEVIWINSELGYGDQAYSSALIDEADFHIIDGYGNVDPILSASAEADVWSLIL